MKDKQKDREKSKLYRLLNKEKVSLYHKEYRAKNKEKIQKRHQERYKGKYKEVNIPKDRIRRNKAKESAFDILGRKCCKCGFSDVRALQIDHINGGGSRDRKIGGTQGVYKKVVELGEDSKEKYQVLCANCNWIKRFEKKEFAIRKSKTIQSNLP